MPLDARLWVLHGDLYDTVVTLDGVDLQGSKATYAWTSYGLPPMEPGETYEYTVTICPEGCPDVHAYGPFTLTTGEDLAPPPTPPVLIEMTAEPSDLIEEPYEVGTCKHQMLSQDCFDVGPARHYYLSVEQTAGTTHYGTLNTKGEPLYLTTSDCPVQRLTWAGPQCEGDQCPPTGEVCFDVVAFNMAGAVTEPVEMCWDFGGADGSGGGCTAGSFPVKMPVVVLLLLLGACLARRFFWRAR